jgi:carboxymethylenebutenolidase
VADQLAAEGCIAVAPDFLSGKAPDGKGSPSVAPDAARQLIGGLKQAEIISRLNAVAGGYCCGGGISFQYATEQHDLAAAIVYYGVSPAAAALGRIRAPVLGLYGGDDARVNATVVPAQEEMKRLGKRFEVETYEKAGHAFLRQQDGREGANLRATQKAWPRMVEFLRQAMPARTSSLVPALPVVLSAGDIICVCDEDPIPGPVALASE